MATAPHESKVLLILAGGTICMQASPAGYIPTKGLLQNCLAGHSAFDDGSHPPVSTIIDENNVTRPGDASLRLPTTNNTSVHYTAFEFKTLIDSSAADARYWNIIAQCITQNYSSFDGFVVLHGTDTLAYAASALSFLLTPLHKPVVFTGSQVSIFDSPSDAWDNILGSLLIAGRGLVEEVGIFFHRTLYRGNRSVKIHASEYAAFGTPNLDPIAKMHEVTKEIILSNPHQSINLSSSAVEDEPSESHPNGSVAAVTPLENLVHMDSDQAVVVRVYPGLQPRMLSAILNTPDLKGVIIETFGAGNMPGGSQGQILKMLEEAVARGMVIVNVSQCLNGTVSPIYAPARALEKLGVVYGHDMTTEAAYAKLLYLLASPELDVEEVRRRMGINLRGELSTTKAAIDRTGDTESGSDQKSGKRRNSLVVRSLGWSTYTPTVSGLGPQHE